MLELLCKGILHDLKESSKNVAEKFKNTKILCRFVIMEKESSQIPQEYQIKCEGCGKSLDMRDVNILSHGWIEDGKIVCYDEVDLPYSSSRKIGEAIQWTNDKKAIDLN